MYAESLRHFLKPILAYVDDPTVTEIMINGPQDIWIERKGKVTRIDAMFTTEGLEAAARNLAQYVGRPLDYERPRLDGRLPDGSRVHVVMPPVARNGCTIAIRKFFREKLTVERLVEFGSMTASMARFIDACVNVKENIIVSGGTGSGKTTLLNCVAQYISDDDRILTIEDSAELQLNQAHVVAFESRPADRLGKGKVDMGDLLHSALRLRPDRIVVGEVRGGEAFHLMQAMNTGHGGSLSTVHANTPTDTLRRLESLCLQSGIELPLVAVRAQVASAISIVICCARLQDGQRITSHISEVLPLDERGNYRVQDLFVYTPTHKDSEGRIEGYHSPTGLLPTCLIRMRAYGHSCLTDEFFDPATYDMEPPPIFTQGEGFPARWAPSLASRDGEQPQPLARSHPATATPTSKPEASKPTPTSPQATATPRTEPRSSSASTPRADEAPRITVRASPSDEPSSFASRSEQHETTHPPRPLSEPARIPLEQESLGAVQFDTAGAHDEDEGTDPGSIIEACSEADLLDADDIIDAADLIEAADEGIAEQVSSPRPSRAPREAQSPPVSGGSRSHEKPQPDLYGSARVEPAAIPSTGQSGPRVKGALRRDAPSGIPSERDRGTSPSGSFEPPSERGKSPEPSIQLAEDFAEEAREHTRRSQLPERDPDSRAASGARPGRDRTAPSSPAGRRRKGGVIGRPGDPD